MKKVLPIIASILFFLSCQQTSEESNTQAIQENSKEQEAELQNKKLTEKAEGSIAGVRIDTTQWNDPQTMITDAIFDLRYATTNNFVGEQLYPCPTCWLRPAAARGLIKAANALREKGYRIILFDCYRPLPIQERLWEIKPDATYVTPPTKGSMHNRGLAVDIGLADLTGKYQDMGSPFDYFGRIAHHDYFEHPQDILDRRTLLKETMMAAGFGSIRSEWWHYSFRNESAALSREQWPCPTDLK